jgi:amino-acid N-acetyltransferase
MIYAGGYGGIRPMTVEDIPAVLNLMQPFVDRGILLPRNQAGLAAAYRDYIVFELDGNIRAAAALHRYDDGQTEIAGLAVNEAHMGAGSKMMTYLIDQARKEHAPAVFVLTTQTSDWFEQLGFRPSHVNTLPEKRRALWTPQRGSRVLRLNLS